jgi:cytochrome oxidase Cu insertion factor (SCO1/SenC/PrrC family)
MPLTSVRAGVAAALLFWSLPVAAQPSAGQPAPAAVDVAALGPQVGERVPDFTLRDQHGAPRALRSVLGPTGGLLVFFRSADW